MEIIDEIEHEDGSATYTFDMTEDERRLCVEAGITWMMVAGITGVTPEKVLEEFLAHREEDDSASS
jgi:hypothetical protein